MKIRIDQIRTDGGTQPRAALNYEVIEEYIEAIKAGAKFPPIEVFYDGESYWLADGFHRIDAHFGADHEEIECHVHQGTLQDAQWFSFGANKTNGLYRSNADKQRAIQAALKHPMSSGLSDREIAKHVGVSFQTVADWRKRIYQTLVDSAPSTRTAVRNGKEYQIKVGNIGKTPKPQPVEVEYAPQPVAVMPEPEQPRPQQPTVPISIAPFREGLSQLATARSLWRAGDETYLTQQDIQRCYELLDFFDRKAAGSSVA